MSSLYRRYISGDHEAVWNELKQHNISTLGSDLQSQVESVCRELVDRSLYNIRLIYDRLLALGYHFSEPESAVVESRDADRSLLVKIEEEMGALPLVFRIWHERIASVNFSQHTSQLHGTGQHVGTSSSVAGLGCNPVLIFFSLERCLQLQEELIDDEDDPDAKMKLAQFIPCGGTASNCSPKGFRAPTRSIDAALYNEGFGDISFVDELRTAFRWGGFPFWARVVEKRRPSYPVPNAPDFVNLLPILKEGLVDI